MQEKQFKYTTIRRFAELTGFSENAIRMKTKDGTWQYRVHFTKKNNRIWINLEEVEKWVENTEE